MNLIRFELSPTVSFTPKGLNFFSQIFILKVSLIIFLSWREKFTVIWTMCKPVLLQQNVKNLTWSVIRYPFDVTWTWNSRSHSSLHWHPTWYPAMHGIYWLIFVIQGQRRVIWDVSRVVHMMDFVSSQENRKLIWTKQKETSKRTVIAEIKNNPKVSQ